MTLTHTKLITGGRARARKETSIPNENDFTLTLHNDHATLQAHYSAAQQYLSNTFFTATETVTLGLHIRDHIIAMIEETGMTMEVNIDP